MPLPVITVILQCISSLAIAGGLIFAALQVRDAKRAHHVANFIRLVELQMGLRRLRVEHPELASVHAHDVTNLGSNRDIQEYFLNLMQLSLFEIAWYAHREGQLSDDYFESWVNRMHALKTEESFRKMMANPSMKIIHDDFYTYVQRLMDSPPSAVASAR